MEQSADYSTAFKENLLILQGSRNMELLVEKKENKIEKRGNKFKKGEISLVNPSCK
jgi:hypothetical protein